MNPPVDMTGAQPTGGIHPADLPRLLMAALAAAANAVTVVDSKGRIVWVNPAFSRLTGYAFDEIVGQDTRFLKSGRHDAAFYQGMWRTIGAGQIWHGEVINRRKDGSLYTEEMTITPVRDDAGAITHYIAVKQDVTARKEYEAQLRETQKLESLGLLAGGIAHDFNNLLGPVLGNAEILLEDAGLDERRKECVRDIQRAAQRAAELSRQMLAYAGRAPFQVTTFDLNALTVELLGLLRVSLKPGVELRPDFEPQLPAIRGDPTQVRQVVLNLLLNAGEAVGAAPGRVRVRTRALDAAPGLLADAVINGVRDAARLVMLEVEDTGCGMDDATRARIFDPFFTTKFIGRGLGLAAVRGIVLAHAGALKVYSRLGAGSRFQVYFPASAEPAPVVAPPADVWRGGGRVLVIDDDGDVLATTCHMLSFLGFEPVGAAGGMDGVARFEESPADWQAVLLDLAMPERDGVQVLGELRRWAARVPVIVCSGYAEHDVLQSFGNDPAPAGFLPKPFTLRELQQALRAALAGAG